MTGTYTDRSPSVSSSTTRPGDRSPVSHTPMEEKPDLARNHEQDDQIDHLHDSKVDSPKASSRSLIQQTEVQPDNSQHSPFTLSKDSLLANSTYIFPTFHVLNPYSYKFPSIADSLEPPAPSAQPLAHCPYPVLQYLAPFIDIDSSTLVCDLLDTFFSSAYSSRMHPTCHYIHNYILRRYDVLEPIQPRKTHPALLASMLFVAALSDKALGLFSGPEERDRVCKYLGLVTYRLLNPSRYDPLLSQEDLGLPPSSGTTLGWTNDDLLRALVSHHQPETFPINWPTDYIIALVSVAQDDL